MAGQEFGGWGRARLQAPAGQVCGYHSRGCYGGHHTGCLPGQTLLWGTPPLDWMVLCVAVVMASEGPCQGPCTGPLTCDIISPRLKGRDGSDPNLNVDQSWPSHLSTPDNWAGPPHCNQHSKAPTQPSPKTLPSCYIGCTGHPNACDSRSGSQMSSSSVGETGFSS